MEHQYKIAIGETASGNPKAIADMLDRVFGKPKERSLEAQVR